MYEWNWRAVEVAERYADGLATENQLAALAALAASFRNWGPCETTGQRAAEWAVYNRLGSKDQQADRDIVGNPFRPIIENSLTPGSYYQRQGDGNGLTKVWDQRRAPEGSIIFKLAQALYDGVLCSYALHDALEEAGHGELAGHFADEELLVCKRDCGNRHHPRCKLANGDGRIKRVHNHPKGCHVVDLIFGKE